MSDNNETKTDFKNHQTAVANRSGTHLQLTQIRVSTHNGLLERQVIFSHAHKQWNLVSGFCLMVQQLQVKKQEDVSILKDTLYMHHELGMRGSFGEIAPARGQGWL